jgi:iron complex outermembrane receptor protein
MIDFQRLQIIIILLSCFVLNGHSQTIDKAVEYYQPHDSIILLNEVKVVSYRVSERLHTIPGSLSVLIGDGLNQTDGNSLAATLNSMPGVTMQSGTLTTSRIVIRGMGSRTPYNTNRIRTYLNDIPLTSADGVSTPEEIDLQYIDRMEIIKGPSSALFGSGLGGSINMYTPVKTINEGIINTQYGSFNTFKTNLSGSVNSGNANIWGSLSHLRSDGYRENNKYKRSSLLTTAVWKQPKWSLKTTMLLIDVNGGIPSSLGITLFENNPKAAAENWKAVEGYKKYRKAMLAATLSNKIRDRLTSNLTIFAKLNDNYEKRPFNNLDDQSLSGGLRHTINHKTDKIEWVAGTELITEQYKWSLDKDNYLLNKNSENRYHVDIFAMLYYKPTPRLNISMAGAVNRISYRLNDLYLLNGDQSGKRVFPIIFSPRIGVNYAKNDHLAVYASIGHGFSLPSPEETLLPEGEVNTNIKPEQGIQYEIGTRINILNRFMELDGSLYRIELSNLLLTKRITEDIFTGINAGKTRHQGIELLITNRWFNANKFPGKLTSVISYTRSFNRFIEFTDNGNNYNGNHLPGIPDRYFQMKQGWKPVKSLEITPLLQYSGKQYLNDSNMLTYPSYFLSSIKVTAQLPFKESGLINIYTGVNNLSNTHYASMLIVNALGFGDSEPRYYYPGLPRHLYAGIQFRF